ncbi:hypothetical protein [Streptomyces sp. CB02009]|uniref:hypothetical protein n=1 Tax=Streptomyces sp. CB02009 TaxID=1703938 RepID=UPI00093AB411|nr:hypothetical protein [Streptomyces sp. CB02009]
MARKEAYLKGLGIGRGRESSADGVRGDLPGWCLTDLSVDSGYAAVLAVSSPTLSTVRLRVAGLTDLSSRRSDDCARMKVPARTRDP